MPSLFRFKDRLSYAWLLVAAFFITGTTIWGIRLSFGVFFKSIEAEFDLSRAATSGIFSIYMVIGSLSAILGGWALDKYGPRIVVFSMGIIAGLSLLLTGLTSSPWQLFITYSLLLAVGTSSMYTVMMSTVSRWFVEKRGLALGIASSGSGLGTVVMAPFATYLISNLEWRMAYIVMGFIAWLIVIPLSRILKKEPHEIGVLPDRARLALTDMESEETVLPTAGISLIQALRTRSFWLIMSLWLFFAFSIFLVLTHIVPHATDIGYSAAEAATILSLIGFSSLAGRVLMGAASDRIGRRLTPIICSLLQAAAVVWLMWAQDFWMLYLFAIVFGFAWGGIGPTMAVLISDIFGLGEMGRILGVLDIGFGAGAAIGPAVGGLIFDVSNSYFMAFLIGALAMLAAPIFIALTRRETERSH